jgi:hypothetical protein
MARVPAAIVAALMLVLPAAAQAHDVHAAHPNAACIAPGLGTADVTFDLSPDLDRVRAVVHVRVDDGPVADFDQLVGPGRSFHVDLRFVDAGQHTVRIVAELIDTQFHPGQRLAAEDRSFTFSCAPAAGQPSSQPPSESSSQSPAAGAAPEQAAPPAQSAPTAPVVPAVTVAPTAAAAPASAVLPAVLPAVHEAVGRPAACISMPKRLTVRARERTTITVRVRGGQESVVRLVGPGIRTRKATHRGRAVFHVRARRAGRLVVQSTACFGADVVRVGPARDTNSNQAPLSTG